MLIQQSRRPPSVLAAVLAAAGLVLTVASCTGHITPIGPEPTPVAGRVTAVAIGPLRQLGSPIILQVMHSQSPTAAGGCPGGLAEVSLPQGAAPMPCFRPVGTSLTLTSAAISPVSTYRTASPPGQPAPPVSYGFMVGVPPAQVTAVTALIKQAYNAHGALGVSVDGNLWEAAQIAEPFSGGGFQIALLSRSQALQLHHLLVPPG